MQCHVSLEITSSEDLEVASLKLILACLAASDQSAMAACKSADVVELLLKLLLQA